MNFEEFFKKKKINLAPLQTDEPALFAEFKTHYQQMGEKSFDHTKKYWFNQLRRRFPAPVEVKVEKIIIENQIAEQTIADSLTEPATPPPSVGFKPRFKPGMGAKPAEEKVEPETANVPASVEKASKTTGFKPHFKVVMAAKTAEEKPEPETPKEEPSALAITKPAGFKPRFQASMVSTPAQDKEPEIKDLSSEKGSTESVPKPSGFTPRFKTKPKQ